MPEDTADMAKKYPKAHALHRLLVDTYGMGAISYAEGIRVPLTRYIAEHVPANLQLKLSWALFPRTTTIKNNIDANKPVLITTTFFGGVYKWHTMAVYGYREISGSTELLVHTGWYGEDYNSSVANSKDIFVHNETWISKSYATYGYYFSFK
jgi:hypothetical protein